MTNFSDSLITKYAQEGERLLAAETNCIQERIVLNADAFQSDFQLPTSTIGITRVTWKGFKLDPYSAQELKWSGSVPLSPTAGRPLYYIYSDVGFHTIKIYPAIPEDLPVVPGDAWSPDVIGKCLVVQYTSQPQFLSSSLRVPSHIRRQFVKDYVLYRCFQRAGKAMDDEASQYFAQKFERNKADNKESWRLLTQAVVRIRGESEHWNPRLPGRPVLPSNFGYVVEEI